MTETVEVVERKEPGVDTRTDTALAVATEAHAPANLFGAASPEDVVDRAVQVAGALKKVVQKQGLIANIQGKEYPQVEAWTLLGSMLGVFPVVEWTRRTDDGNGWECRVVVQTRAGEIVGSAEAECTRSERSWAKRDDYALRGMAQTRATSRAMRGPLGFVMTLAGYQALDASEMPSDDDHAPPAAPAATAGGAGAEIGALRNKALQLFGNPGTAAAEYTKLTGRDITWKDMGYQELQVLVKAHE